MLSKLIKHEFKTTGRYIIMIMAVLAIVTPITAIYLKFGDNFFDNLAAVNSGFDVFNKILVFLCTTIYVLSVLGVCLVTSICLIYRFYKSMVSTESYLTHTLPVKTSSILISKGLVALIWSILSIILMFASILVFTKIVFGWSNSDFARGFVETFKELNVYGVTAGHIIVLAIAMLIGLVSNITQFGVSFALGHKLNGHPVLGAIVSYIGINTALQIITSIVISVISGLRIVNLDHISTPAAFYLFCFFVIAYEIVTSVLFYLVTLHIFKNKLNV